ncbi:site-specific integrase [Paraburkholderia saeva]|uniref:Defective protein IntQ n=1 Tax=Paraburkholderia saeva TaxID=2777537 RepID=A0A9N8RXU8_9BURK|nr:site-specific integrase [Paraburkholderia saeva]CAG4900410.1 Putative defective protein IntQ [Paraburkholderia saeva]
MGRNGTGVRPISGSTIEVTFSYKGQRCRERIKLEPTAANLKRVENFLGSVRNAIANGTFDYRVSFPNSKNASKFMQRAGDGTLFSDFLDGWIERQRKVLKASTVEGYESVIETHLKPQFGATTLPDLKRAQFREWCAKQEFSNKRMTNVLSVARAALAEAVQDELLEANVLSGWTYQRKEALKPDDDVDPFTAEEQRAILGAADQPQDRNLFQFAFWAGLRTSELIGFKWTDIDWTRNEARISRATTRAARAAKVDESTKTRGSTRVIKLLGPAMQALVDQKPHTFLLNDTVFMNPRTSKPWHNDQAIRVAWNRLIHKAKVRYRRPYQTRHTYASMMLSAGEPPMWVASQMGHTSLKMLEQRYGRWMKDSAPDAGDKAVLLFGGLDEKAGRFRGIS